MDERESGAQGYRVSEGWTQKIDKRESCIDLALYRLGADADLLMS